MFFIFGNGITTGNHATAWGMPCAQAQSLSPKDMLCHGELTCYIDALTILDFSHGSTHDSVKAAFTSVQAPNAGGHEQATQQLEDDLHVDPDRLELAQ